MLSLIQFLEDIEQGKQMVVLPAPEVERLVERFGPNVRRIGFWNKTTDGSVEVPVGNITEALRDLDNRSLTDAVAELKFPDQFAGVLTESSAARKLIDALCSLQERQFREKVERYQGSANAAETEQLRDEIGRELFGP